jgi:hypothetical protein
LTVEIFVFYRRQALWRVLPGAAARADRAAATDGNKRKCFATGRTIGWGARATSMPLQA